MSSEQILIGLSGRRGVGKSTVARWLCDEHGFRELSFADPLKRLCQRLWGGDTLPDATLWGPSAARDATFTLTPAQWGAVHARIVDGGPDIVRLFAGAPEPVPAGVALGGLHELVHDLEAQGEVSARGVLQQVGTEWGRALWPLVWISAAFDHARDAGPRVVISDVRFTNEARALVARGGQLWVIVRPERPERPERPGAPPAQSPIDTHASEPNPHDFAPFARSYLVNDGDLRALHAAADSLACEVCGDAVNLDLRRSVTFPVANPAAAT